MKLLLENWRQYLNEIGGGENPYQFRGPKPLVSGRELFDMRGGDPSVVYEFKTPENDYYVDFTHERDDDYKDWWIISFELARMKAGQRGLSLTGEGKPLQVVSTVVAIIKNFIQKYTEKYTEDYIKKYPKFMARDDDLAFQHASSKLNFKFVGIAKEEEQTDANKNVEATGRTRLYRAFLKRHMPPGTEIINFTENEIGFKAPITARER